MPDHQLLILGYIPPDLRAALAERFALVELDRSRAEPWTGFDIAVTTGIVGAGAREFDACPDLRLVVSQGIGLETIDLAEARRRGIAVAHTPDEIAADVGDAAIAMIYAVLRGTLRADAFVRQGRWGRERIAATRRVAGRTVGVVGLGRIGRHVADRAQAIGMQVLYHARSRKDAPYAHVADVVTLAERSDVLVLACPGGEASLDGKVIRDIYSGLVGKDITLYWERTDNWGNYVPDGEYFVVLGFSTRYTSLKKTLILK